MAALTSAASGIVADELFRPLCAYIGRHGGAADLAAAAKTGSSEASTTSAAGAAKVPTSGAAGGGDNGSVPLQESMEFVIQVEKSSEKALGLEIKYNEASGLIDILRVKAGSVQDWNDANVDRQVCQWHTIVEVNGMRSQPRVPMKQSPLYLELKKQGVLSMVIQKGWADLRAKSSRASEVPTATMRKPLEVHVSGLAGPLCDLMMNLPCSLSDLKTAIAAKTGIHAYAQKLVHGVEELTAETSLLDFPEGEVIDLMLVQSAWGAGSLLQRVLEGSMTDAAVEVTVARGDVQGNRDVVLAAVARVPRVLRHASVHLRADHEIVLAAVLKDGNALEFAADELQMDRRIALAAVVGDRAALQWVAPEVRADCEFLLDAVARHGTAHALHKTPGLSLDREAVLAVVAKDGTAVQHASAELQEDRDVAIAAVTQCAASLQCLPAKHRADRGIMLAAVRQEASALLFASRELKADREVVLAAARKDKTALQIAAASLRADSDFLELVHGHRPAPAGKERQVWLRASDFE